MFVALTGNWPTLGTRCCCYSSRRSAQYVQHLRMHLQATKANALHIVQGIIVCTYKPQGRAAQHARHLRKKICACTVLACVRVYCKQAKSPILACILQEDPVSHVSASLLGLSSTAILSQQRCQLACTAASPDNNKHMHKQSACFGHLGSTVRQLCPLAVPCEC